MVPSLDTSMDASSDVRAEQMARLRGMLSEIELDFEQVLNENASLRIENEMYRAHTEQPPQPHASNLKLDQALRLPQSAGHVVAEASPRINNQLLTVPLVGRGGTGLPTSPMNSASPVNSIGLPFQSGNSSLQRGVELLISAHSDQLSDNSRTMPSASSTPGHRDISAPDSDDVLNICPAWHEKAARMSRSISRSSSRTRATSEILHANVKRTGDALTTNSRLQRFISKPSSAKRIFWDMLSVAVMAYDLVTIPLQLLDLPDNPVMYTVGMFATIFWTLDICLSFLSGYHAGGLIEMRPKQVAFRYIRTWMPIDVVVVAVDWAVFIVDSNSMESFGMMRLNKTLRIVRILRVLRMLRLLRMLKVMSLIAELHDMIHSEAVLTSLNIVSFIFGILLLSHYIACSWYGVGHSQVTEYGDPRDSWVSKLQLSTSMELGSGSAGYYYATALHWSLTQFTPASMEVVPCNTVERLFNVGVIVISVIIFSSVLSSITSAMINLRRKSAEKRRQIGLVRRYITDKHLTLALGNRIVGFLRTHNYNVSQQQSLQENQILAFKILPDSLRTQLRCEIHVPVLIAHPLFYTINRMDKNAMVAICTTAMSERDLPVGHELFVPGMRATHMYISVTGSLVYFQGDSLKMHEDVDPGTFISEGVLWLIWETRGRLVATSACDLVAASAEAFHQVMASASSRPMCRFYAHQYRDAAQDNETQDFDMLTDIGVIDHDLIEMVKSSYAQWSEVSDTCLMDYAELGEVGPCSKTVGGPHRGVESFFQMLCRRILRRFRRSASLS
mmetsp:Transcript_79275/g.230214  ORF Transcript_79275/g.230214 Transcript_79275/m.230214 type:complete len:787 (+) Transcript_79275:49-2409(+)